MHANYNDVLIYFFGGGREAEEKHIYRILEDTRNPSQNTVKFNGLFMLMRHFRWQLFFLLSFSCSFENLYARLTRRPQ